MEDTDTVAGGGALSVEQAASAFVKSQAGKETVTSQSEPAAEDESAQTDDELQASNEDVSDETDGETEDAGQAGEDDPDAEPETERGRYVAHNGRVKLPDGSESTVQDLIQGNLRDRDYRQKTMEAAEIKKTFGAQSEALKASQQQIQQQAEYVAGLVRSIVPPMPAADMLDTDPMGYWKQRSAHEEWVAHLNYLDGQRQQSEQERQAETTRQMQERGATEWNALLEKAPEFKDQKRSESFAREVHKYGTEIYGFTPDEIRNGVGLDHRQALVLKDAIAWRKLQANKATVAKKVEGRPPVQKGGKRLNPSERGARAAVDAIATLKSAGTVEAAAAAWIASRKG